MRKLIAGLIVALAALSGFTAPVLVGNDGMYGGAAPTTLFDYTDGTVTYIGTAYTEANTTALVSTNAAKWNIVKITKSGGQTTGIYVACTTNVGSQSMAKSVWALRAATNTFYKTAE